MEAPLYHQYYTITIKENNFFDFLFASLHSVSPHRLASTHTVKTIFTEWTLTEKTGMKYENGSYFP